MSEASHLTTAYSLWNRIRESWRWTRELSVLQYDWNLIPKEASDATTV